MVVWGSVAFAKADVDNIFDSYLSQRTPQFLDSSGTASHTDSSDSEVKKDSPPETAKRTLKRPRSETEKKERRRAQNRQAAATSREKKKKYHQTLETQVQSLSSQNQELQAQLQRLLAENKRLLNKQPAQSISQTFNPFAFQMSSSIPSIPCSTPHTPHPLQGTPNNTNTTATVVATTTSATPPPTIAPITTSATTTTAAAVAGTARPHYYEPLLMSPGPMISETRSTAVAIESAELPNPQQPEVMAMVLVAMSMGFLVQAVLLPIMLLRLNMSRLRAFSRRGSQSSLVPLDSSCSAKLACRASETSSSMNNPQTSTLISAPAASWSSPLPPQTSAPG